MWMCMHGVKKCEEDISDIGLTYEYSPVCFSIHE